MTKRVYLFLFLAVCTAFLSFLEPSNAVADGIGSQKSVEVTYIQYGIIGNHAGPISRSFRLEGVADGYQTPPELTLVVNGGLRQVPIYFVNCPAGQSNPTQLCWETEVFIEPYSLPAHFDFLVVDPVNGATGTAEISFRIMDPTQCSPVCGV